LANHLILIARDIGTTGIPQIENDRWIGLGMRVPEVAGNEASNILS
jgi:hypothetical protein